MGGTSSKEKEALGSGYNGQAPPVYDDAEPPADKPYSGMGKEDLLRFSNTTFWIRFRLICLGIFWLGWLALLGAVIGLTIAAPRCGDPPAPAWWEKSTFYQIYVRSFYDYDGDGIGDIKGVISKLPYLKELNVRGLVLSSIYESEGGPAPVGHDFGYEITDHKAIDTVYGTMDDFDELISEAHDLDLSIIMDFVPNHSGTSHPWFEASSTNKDPSNEFWNYYIWADCDDGSTPPNNWMSTQNGPAWTYIAARGQCYLHQGLQTQPDLNLRSSAVNEQLESILEYWLDRGVDGFRVTTPQLLYEDGDLRDDDELCPDPTYACRAHDRSANQPEVHDAVARWRSYLDNYNQSLDKVLITDADTSVTEVLRYYGTHGRNGAGIPTNYELRTATDELKEHVVEFVGGIPTGATGSWLLGSQDRARITDDGEDQNDELLSILQVLQMTLPGVPVVYYGEEIGMRDGGVDGDDPISPSRFPFRTPMQWDNTTYAGFVNGSGTPWNPVNDHETRNVLFFSAPDNSLLSRFKQLTQLRLDEESLQFGNIEWATDADTHFIAYVREYEGRNRLLIAANLGSTSIDELDVARKLSIIPNKADVVLTTRQDTYLEPEEEFDLRKLTLQPLEAAIFTWEYSR